MCKERPAWHTGCMSAFLLPLIALVALCYALYGILLAYHWLRFSTSRALAVLSLASYYLCGAVLSLMALASVPFIGSL